MQQGKERHLGRERVGHRDQLIVPAAAARFWPARRSSSRPPGRIWRPAARRAPSAAQGGQPVTSRTNAVGSSPTETGTKASGQKANLNGAGGSPALSASSGPDRPAYE